VSNAIEAAGGLQPDADQSAVNLAARLLDGQKIVVPKINEPVTGIESSTPQSEQTKPQSGLATPSKENPINLNSASAEEFDLLPGIGPTHAADIVAYRTQHGSFNTIDEIMNIPGIGQATFDRIKDLIYVEPAQ
jgi:competence protein ComEA